jgi:hypothetical protein
METLCNPLAYWETLCQIICVAKVCARACVARALRMCVM